MLKTHPNPHNEVLSILSAARGSHPEPSRRLLDRRGPADGRRSRASTASPAATCTRRAGRASACRWPRRCSPRCPVITVAHWRPRRLLLGRDGADRPPPDRACPAPTSPCPARPWAEPDRAELSRRHARGLRRPGPSGDREQGGARQGRHRGPVLVGRRRRRGGPTSSTCCGAEARTLDLVAMVTPWNSRCGIAEYSRQLVTGFGTRARTARPGRPERAAGGPRRGAVDHPRLGRPLAPRPERPDVGARRLPGRAACTSSSTSASSSWGAGRVHRRRSRSERRSRHHVPQRRPTRRSTASSSASRSIADALGRADLPHRPPAGRRRPSGRLRARRQRAARAARCSRTGAGRPRSRPRRAPPRRPPHRRRRSASCSPTRARWSCSGPSTSSAASSPDVLLLAPCAIHPDPIGRAVPRHVPGRDRPARSRPQRDAGDRLPARRRRPGPSSPPPT